MAGVIERVAVTTLEQKRFGNPLLSKIGEKKKRQALTQKVDYSKKKSLEFFFQDFGLSWFLVLFFLAGDTCNSLPHMSLHTLGDYLL